MHKARLSLRRRPVVKAPPPGVTLKTELPRPGLLRVGDIVERMRPEERPHGSFSSGTLEQREAVLARAEEALSQREHAFRNREATLIEREREALETIKLAEVREARAIQHEALIAANRDDLERAETLKRLQNELARLHEEKRAWKVALAQANADLDELELELAKAQAQAKRAGSELNQPMVEKPAKADTDSLLTEREAFIEESENTLFHRAQELQELEMHLQQWQEELNHRAKEMGLTDAAPEELLLAPDPAQMEENLAGLQNRE